MKTIMKQNNSKYTLSKKGAISFIFSKFAFIIFAVIIAATFFYVVSMQHEIQNLNRIAKTSESISNTIEMVSASEYDVWITYESELDLKINFETQDFTIYDKEELSLKRGLLFPINSEFSDNGISISCLNITNIEYEETVIKKCQ